MVYLLFFIAATCTIFLAVKLSKYVDVIKEKSSINGVLLGLMLGGATSLPEITTSVTSIIINNPDIATGNVLGSNLFNFMILAVVDIIFRKSKIFNYSNKQNTMTNLLVMALLIMISASMYFKVSYHIFGIGLDSIILVIVYSLGMWFISKVENEPSAQPVNESESQKYAKFTLKRALISFIVAAIFILVFGSILTVSADKIATLTGIDASFIGTFLVAASTSLPEAVSIIVAVRLLNYNLAIGSILGSNTFNILILIFTDVLYRKGSLLYVSSPSHIYTVLGTIVLAVICMYALIRKQSKNGFTYLLPSILAVISYFVVSYLMFIQA
ncbi:sodium:calcium antiporter [Chengkuizengella axinellae]|uniref:Sodium:calcium antiporter n=1 Tax=Chengkuizengella axinellae TaxID=3064388 RepID=A0ABT9J7R2_9BACL|nr:sodium:calcium antiporter [Chengkuizengella sp. 2205SS18-9]MDP5277035.1 sodium:calcium antiporter [Chengkuizengella sp. 2205SS18-9]